MAFRNLNPNVSSALAKRIKESGVTSNEYAAEGSASASSGVRYMAVVLGPSQTKMQPRKSQVEGKRDFAGTATQPMMLIGTPCGPEPNRASGGGAVRHWSGRWASMPASHLAYDDGLPEGARRPDVCKRKMVKGDKRFYMFNGCKLAVECFGTVVRATHRREDGSKIEQGQGEELPVNSVVEIVISDPMVNGENVTITTRYLRVRGVASDEQYANLVLYAHVTAAQNVRGPNVGQLPFHPPQLDPSIDWSQVVGKKRSADADGGSSAMNTDSNSKKYDADESLPTLDKISALHSAALDHPSREASFCPRTISSCEQPGGVLAERDARAGWSSVMSANMFFSYDNPEQFIKVGKDQVASALAANAYNTRPTLNMRLESLNMMSLRDYSHLVEVRALLTLPQATIDRFGFCDPDMQIHSRMFLHNGVYTLRASTMINTFFHKKPWHGESFKISGYPSIKYNNKVADWNTLELFVDPACTVANTTLPVPRTTAIAAHIGLMKSPLTRNPMRHAPRMDMVRTNNKYVDTAKVPIPTNNPWHTQLNAQDEELVVNLTECSRDVALSYPEHQFRVLVDSVAKNDPSVVEFFAKYAKPDGPTDVRGLILGWAKQINTLICLRNNIAPVDLNKLIVDSIARVREEFSRQPEWAEDPDYMPLQMQPDFFYPGDPGLAKPTPKEVEAGYRAPTVADFKKLYGAHTVLETVAYEELIPALQHVLPPVDPRAPPSRPGGRYSTAQPFAGAVIPFAIDFDYALARGIDLYTDSVDTQLRPFQLVENMFEDIKSIVPIEQYTDRLQAEEDAESERLAVAAERAAAAAKATAATELTRAAASVSSAPLAAAAEKKRPAAAPTAAHSEDSGPDAAAHSEDSGPDADAKRVSGPYATEHEGDDDYHEDGSDQDDAGLSHDSEHEFTQISLSDKDI